MIIVLKPNCPEEQVKKFTDSLTQEYNVKVNTWVGTQSTVLGLLGDTTSIDIDYIAAQDFVESVKRVQEPYKKANRKCHPDNTVITPVSYTHLDVYRRQALPTPAHPIDPLLSPQACPAFSTEKHSIS